MDMDIWERIAAGDTAARDEAIAANMPLLHYTALRLVASMPPFVEVDDLVSYGVEGLISAIERFEPERGLKFSTYAVRRIRGAMIDELRSMDWAPRRLRREARRINAAIDSLNARLQREPTPEEVAEELDEDLLYTEALMSEIVLAQAPLSLDWLHGEQDDQADDEVSLQNALPATDDVEAQASLTEVRESVAGGLARLCMRDRAVLAMHYLEDMSYADISALLGVSESRIYQIHSRAMGALRQAVAI